MELGSGKSVLVQSFLNSLPNEILRIQGKFDQLHSHTPYSALVSASDQLCRQIMKLPNCDDIRQRIRFLLESPEITLLGNLIPMLHKLASSSDVDDSEKILCHREESNQANTFGKIQTIV
jgi:predicted ATPase